MNRATRLQRARKAEAESINHFHAAHEEGMAALRRHDYSALAKAITDESAAIKKHRNAIDQSNQAFKEVTHDGG